MDSPSGSEELKDPREESFCQLVAKGAPKGKSWLKCFQTKAKDRLAAANNAQARLMSKSHIKARLEYLKRGDPMADLLPSDTWELTLDHELRKNFAVRELLLQKQDFDGALKYSKHIAQLSGMIGVGSQHLHLHQNKEDSRTGGEILEATFSELRSLFPGGSLQRAVEEIADQSGGGDETSGASGKAPVASYGVVPAISEAETIPPGGGDIPETLPDGGESGREDLLGFDGSSLPSDGSVP